MELDRADVVEMAEQGEQTPPQLVVPHLDLVIIACWARAREQEFGREWVSTGTRILVSPLRDPRVFSYVVTTTQVQCSAVTLV